MDEPKADAQGHAPFWFGINSCFTITGRGTVVGGAILSGSIRVNDAVDLVHNGWTIRTRVTGVEMGHGRRPDGTTRSFLGLMLDGVRRFEVVPGDYVSSPATGPEPNPRSRAR